MITTSTEQSTEIANIDNQPVRPQAFRGLTND
jgi:hypothetical protein